MSGATEAGWPRRWLRSLAIIAILCAALSACTTNSPETTDRSTLGHGTSVVETLTTNASRTGSSAPNTGTAAGQSDSVTQDSATTEGFCGAVAAINEIPDSDTLSPAEQEHALQVIDNLLRLWPAEAKAAAQTYFGEIRKAVEAGAAVDLDNTSQGFQQAFADVFQQAAEACPGGFG